jgi:thiol-disulfide isomerase/thioredoxin
MRRRCRSPLASGNGSSVQPRDDLPRIRRAGADLARDDPVARPSESIRLFKDGEFAVVLCFPWSRAVCLSLALCVLVTLSGCGGAGTTPPAGQTAGPRTASTSTATPLPTTSISSASAASAPTGSPAASGAADDDDEAEMFADKPGEPADLETDDDLAPIAVPEAGSVEASLQEMTQLRLTPPKSENVDELKAERKARNAKIVLLAQDVITRTHDAADKDRLFNAAVHHLMEARVQLALAGDKEAIDGLYGDAGALFKRNPKSKAAAEGAYALVNLAYSQARQTTPPDPHWLQEFARQAKHYALSFPAEELKAVPLLFTAARSCELNNLTEQAVDCYTTIQQSFPRSPFASRSVGISRRLALPGQIVSLSGPKLGGEMLTTDDLLGQTVVVVFWSTETQSFREILPTLLQAQAKYAKSGVSFVGVNFDVDPSKVNPFLIEQKMGWPQIVFEKETQRGWSNPIATFYGIMDIPTLWVIDAQGQVISTNIAASELDSLLERQAK